MFRDAFETIVSGILIFAIGYLLWPPFPGQFYWGGVSDVVGGFVTLLVVIGLCFSFGFIVRKATPITPVNFAIGGLLAYLVGMYLIAATMEPDSPVHWLGYGLMVAGMIFGHAPREILDAATDGFVRMLDLSPPR
jgi:drug/metabolite transporter (DMT)-like permease